MTDISRDGAAGSADQGPKTGGERAPIWGTSADSPHAPIEPHDHPASFDLAYSGGWGSPDHDGTGPIPRLGGRGAEADSDLPAARGEDAATVHGLPAEPTTPAATTWHETGEAGLGAAGSGAVSAARTHPSTTPADQLATPPTSPVPQVSPASSQPQTHPEQPRGLRGSLAGLADIGFRTRTTRQIAPVAYAVLLAWLVIRYLGDVYIAAIRAAALDVGALEVLLTVVVGLGFVVLGAIAGRLVLELCCNIADMADSRHRDADER